MTTRMLISMILRSSARHSIVYKGSFVGLIAPNGCQAYEPSGFQCEIGLFEEQQQADDIEDQQAYSIEESKRKSEQDKLLDLAEKKKADTRRRIGELRLKFKRLKEQNDKLPDRIRLHKKAVHQVGNTKSQTQSSGV
ncbi:unnamed protein product [Protopolystoma xenopodis]|uniref:Uncharacterized protein n=1 Tax=Protopolystoma xenopodis TaxID=117903 RepID=A0A448XCK6_9PLAT|nr:unnamed protein product [Protopolystoma xenopodis]